MTHHIQREPRVRILPDGMRLFTDAAVLEARERAEDAHGRAWATRRQVSIEHARALRERIGIA